MHTTSYATFRGTGGAGAVVRPALCLLVVKTLFAASLGLLAGCQMPVGVITPSHDVGLESLVPVPGVSLNRSTPGGSGLLAGADRHGNLVLDGPDTDPQVREARRYYDHLPYPNRAEQQVSYADPDSGAPAAPKLTAPLTFAAWKQVFGFSARAPSESLDDYRQRTGVVTYYNKNELGLGRELGCHEFPAGADAQGAPQTGIGCFVTNYGAVFRDEFHSLAEAIEGEHPRNTVCISWDPSMDPGYEVQFYVYGGDGNRLEWAQLDSHGPRALPQVCTGCHGGVYDDSKHLSKFARFLPMDPNVVVFASGAGILESLTRDGQEERIRAINALSLRTPLTPAQREMIDLLYRGRVTEEGATSAATWIPAGWRGSTEDQQMFDGVVKPYCTTCHLAMQSALDGSELFTYGLFRSPEDLRRFPLDHTICGAFAMPNAQPTLINFWETKRAGVAIGKVSYSSAADALLAFLGNSRSTCLGFAESTSCVRGPDPDALCGNDSSGTACDRDTGRCFPEFIPDEPASARVKGVCRLDGSRACPHRLVCIARATLPAGMSDYDGICVPERGL